jgi:osmotically-inducible protein OsmY
MLVAMHFSDDQLTQQGDHIMVKLQRSMIFLVCFTLLTVFTVSAASEKSETAGQYVDDSVITTRVKAAIFKEETLKTLQINVKTYKGVVQLSGFVDSAESISKAGEVAGRVENVVSVENDLLIK